MIEKPRFKESFSVSIISNRFVFLLNEYQHFVLLGKVYVLLAPLLDGTREVSDLLVCLGDKLSAPNILYALKELEEKKYIVEGTNLTNTGAIAFWDGLDINPDSALKARPETAVSVHPVGNVNPQPMIDSLAANGITVSDKRNSLKIVITDDYLHAEIASINAEACANNVPFILVKPVGMVIWVGPLVIPGETACWECMAQRIRGNRQVENYILRKTGQQGPLVTSRSVFPTAGNIAINLATAELAKWLSGCDSTLLAKNLVTIDMTTLKIEKHAVVRRPQCTVCGNARIGREQKPHPIEITSHLKKFKSDDGHYAVSPQETWNRHKKHISPITGVISSLVSKTETSDGMVHSYAAGHAFPMLSDNMIDLRANMRYRSGGKGLTDLQARVAAICEAIERYSGVCHGNEPIVTGSYTELKPKAIHPNDCMLYSDQQYQARNESNKTCTSNFQVVPEPFDENEKIAWTHLWSLTNKEFRLLPSAYCYYGHHELKKFFCTADSNGNAAGNTIEEAILQGLMELVERDSVAIWWYNQLRMPELDINSLDTPYLLDLREYYRKKNRELWVLDITSDLGIPTFAAISRRVDKPVEDILLGFSANLDPKVALFRSLTEVNQILPALSASDKDGNTLYWYDDKEAIKWWKTSTLENRPYCVPDPSAPCHSIDLYKDLASNDMAENINICIDVLRKNGLEFLVLDQTQQDIGLSVVKVVAPGLRHFWNRKAPGRLYDVPEKLGWLGKKHAENELNPIPMFF